MLPLSGWLVRREIAFITVMMRIVQTAMLMRYLRRMRKLFAARPTSYSLVILLLRQLRHAHSWFRNSKGRNFVVDFAKIRSLQALPIKAPLQWKPYSEYYL